MKYRGPNESKHADLDLSTDSKPNSENQPDAQALGPLVAKSLLELLMASAAPMHLA